ncbi:MAG: hypothetical protein KGL39_29540 [Patescibacteria group bacterium]|nr:hypothetical protein [Patescibacteria group bacterium]
MRVKISTVWTVALVWAALALGASYFGYRPSFALVNAQSKTELTPDQKAHAAPDAWVAMIAAWEKPDET